MISLHPGCFAACDCSCGPRALRVNATLSLRPPAKRAKVGRIRGRARAGMHASCIPRRLQRVLLTIVSLAPLFRIVALLAYRSESK